MKFGVEATEDAAGAILAHTLRVGVRVFKKGQVLRHQDLIDLAQAGLAQITTARLETADMAENSAARTIAAALAGTGTELEFTLTGRVNLRAAERGLLIFDAAMVDRVNEISEDITLATLLPYAPVERKQVIASIKIIPFAVPSPVVRACESAASPAFEVRAFQRRSIWLVQTATPGIKDKILEKTMLVTSARVSRFDGHLVGESRCAHTVDEVTRALEAARPRADLLLIVGSSAIVDRRDVIPAAIGRLGGVIECFGMPTEPGNLMLVARLGQQPVLGLPGCARSPTPNGLDSVLARLAAGISVTRKDIARMGVGGLLLEA
jgi:molybdenum cofactor cytidylyltransferase